MYGRPSNKLKTSLSVLFFWRFDLVKKKKLPILVIISLILALLALPQILFYSLVDRDEYSSRISKFASDSHLIISWDGISENAYRGIIFHNVRISLDTDLFRLKNIAIIPELKVIPDYMRTLTTLKFTPRTIFIKSAKWKYWVNSNEMNQFLNQKIGQLLKQNPEFHIKLKNNDISLIFEKKNYEREIWNIFLNSGSIKSHDNILKTSFEYNDVAWGKGLIVFIPDLCEQCDLHYGDYNIQVYDLPVNRLSWFFKSYKLKDGFIDGSLNGYFKKANNTSDILANISIKIDQLVINDESDNSIFSNDRIKLDFNYSEIQKNLKSDFSGYWNKSRFSGVFNKKQGSLWPELCTFELENKGKHELPLVYGYRIKGLKEIKLDIKEDPKKQYYRLISGNLFVDSGRVFDSSKNDILRLPLLDLKIKNNEFTGNVKLLKGNSDIGFDFKGSVVPVMMRINTLIEFEDYKKNKPLDYDTVVFQVSEEGKLLSSNFIWTDIHPFYAYLVSKWNMSLSKDQYKGWRPSILRDREWFQKYIMRTDLKNDIIISHWSNQKTTGSKDTISEPATGILNYSNSFLEFALNTTNLDYALKMDTSSSYPVIRGEYKLQLNDMDVFSMLWIPPDFTEDFESCQIDYSFSTSGERPVDLLSNYLGNGTLIFNKSRLEKKTGNTDVWDILTVNLKKYGDKIMLNMEGKNPNSTLSSWGNFNENDDNQWDLKTSVYEIR